MDESKESLEAVAKETAHTDKAKRNRIIGGIILVAVIAVAAVTVYLLRQEPDKMDFESNIILDENDQPPSTPVDRMTLEYKNICASDDGRHVSCYLANSSANQFNMWMEILDEEGEQVYESKLLPPGGRMESIELTKQMDYGEHNMTLVFHQVEDDNATEHAHLNVELILKVMESESSEK